MSEKSVGMRVDVFVDQLRDELKKICNAQGKSYDDNQARGFAFQEWVAELLMKYHEVERGKDENVFTTNDLKIDVAFEDDENKILCLSQTKNVSINSDVNESDVLDFFSRHDVFLENPEWVREHASDELHDLISDYRLRLETGWAVFLYFITTGKISERISKLVGEREKNAQKKFPSLSFRVLDLSQLKELVIRARSVEAAITESAEIQFAENSVLIREHPHKTFVAIVKGNTLVNLYRKERERLFAYNIRSFLGKRANKEIIETAQENPDEFFYFNNGISAICTKVTDLGKNKFRFDNFQVINGAQTVGSLAAVESLNSDCYVLLRVTQGVSVKTEKGFNADIIRYNNTQNVVRASDFRANDNIQLWIEAEFEKIKSRGSIKRPMKYVRKRSFKRTRDADPIRFEELAKIRYAFNVEPTRCIADPRSLWTSEEDGGVYEEAFGINGKLEPHWPEQEFARVLFAIITYRHIEKKIKEISSDDKELRYLKRMRFWALRLAAIHAADRKVNFSDFLANSSLYENWFKSFWNDLSSELIAAHHAAAEAQITNFALVRNETRWNNTQKKAEQRLKVLIRD